MQVLGLIVARAGSKGIPNKNVVLLARVPLLRWTIDAAKAATRLNLLAISSDDQECLRYCAAGGGITLLKRPESLAQDDTPTVEVVRHALQFFKGFDAVFTLQPTNPLRSVADIDGPIEMMERIDCDSVMGVTYLNDVHPWRMYTLDSHNRPTEFCRDAVPFVRRQDLPPVYLRTGVVYLTRPQLIEEGKIVGPNCRAWIVPQERAIAIDTVMDLNIAEALCTRDL